jgi:undecaprenyl diphosphate synthase
MTITAYFSAEEIVNVHKARIPRHVAIIPDGNRRWAQKNQMRFDKGHHAGAGKLIEVVKAAKSIGVKAITFFLFSTENWSRSHAEVTALMWLLKRFLRNNLDEMLEEGVRLKTIGDIGALRKSALTVVEDTMQKTAHCTDIDLVFALNYGARDEMRRAIHRIVDHCIEGQLKKEDVTEKLIASYLDTSPWGDPDLLIRTSGEMRISNFLLWQLSYAEIYVSKLLWPEFGPQDFLDAILDFQKRERRLGGT